MLTPNERAALLAVFGADALAKIEATLKPEPAQIDNPIFAAIRQERRASPQRVTDFRMGLAYLGKSMC